MTAHAALWADNGTGKTMITALRFALYLPDTRDFIRGSSDRSLAKLVFSGDVCHVVEQATRVVNGQVQRIVTGMVAHWADGGTRDLDNPSRLERVFYGWVSGPSGPTVDDLPFRTSVGRWATRTQFVDAVRAMLPAGAALPPHPPSEHQKHWREWLIAAGVDIEQVRFQTQMNASEGGAPDAQHRLGDGAADDQVVVAPATTSRSTSRHRPRPAAAWRRGSCGSGAIFAAFSQRSRRALRGGRCLAAAIPRRARTRPACSGARTTVRPRRQCATTGLRSDGGSPVRLH